MPKKSKTEKPPEVDKLLKPAIGVVIAFLGYYFMKGINVEVPRVDVTDELALRETFFGEGQGLNYVALCHTPPTDETKRGRPISSVFSDAMDSLTSTSPTTATFVLIDCEEELPSGKTIAQRFKLDTKKRPTIFVSGRVGPPKQVPEKHLKTGAMLVKLLKSMLEPHAVKIESTKDLKSKCLSKDVCALLLKGGPPQKYLKDAVKNLLTMFPAVPIASLDSSTMLVTNLEEFLPEYKAGEHRFVVFKKVSGGLGEKEGRLITSILTFKDDESMSFNSMSKLIGDASSWGAKTKKLSSLPNIKTRTKKLEEQERKKRERAANKGSQKKQQETPAGSFGSGASTDNDGSKEGRKAERDRRREEHLKNNPDYREKTPEEKAEIERQRRKRMEEESAKWNIGADDAPPEGESIDEDGEFFMEDEEEVEDFDEEDEEEDEDVLDLD